MKINKQIAIGIGIVLLIIFSWLIFFRSDVEDEIGISPADCEKMQEDIVKEIEKMAYCENKNDCVLLNGCAYGCNNLINKNADMTDFVELEAILLNDCEIACESNCAGALKANEIACENKKCVSTKGRLEINISPN